jgi:hypothetical protein
MSFETIIWIFCVKILKFFYVDPWSEVRDPVLSFVVKKSSETFIFGWLLHIKKGFEENRIRSPGTDGSIPKFGDK